MRWTFDVLALPLLLSARPTALKLEGGAADRHGHGDLDLHRCAEAYPDFTSYLDRAFGQRFANPADVEKTPWESTYIFNLVPDPNNSQASLWTIERYGHGDKFKLKALVKVMSGVIERHGHMLRKDVDALGGKVRFFWRFMNGDCAQQRKTKHGLPLQGWSSDYQHDDMALPDFTFDNYPNINSRGVNPEWTSDAWHDVAGRLREVRKTKHGFIWRGDMSSALRERVVQKVDAGPPARLEPLLRQAAPDGFDVKLINWGKHGGVRGTGDGDYISLYDQCKYDYTFHMQGKHYSAMLKYKLACNQTVFMVESKGEEFWYDALKDKKNIYFIKGDLSNFWEVIEEALSPVPEAGLPAGAKAREVAKAGLKVADTYLSENGIDCYVMQYLTNYYFPLYKRAYDLKMNMPHMKFDGVQTI